MVEQLLTDLNRYSIEYQNWKQKQPPNREWFFVIQWVEAFVKETGAEVDYGDLHDYIIDPVRFEAKLRRQQRVNEKRDFFDRKVEVGDKVYCVTGVGRFNSKKTNAILEVVEITPKGTVKGKVLRTALYGDDEEKNNSENLRKLPYDFLIVNQMM